MTKFYTVRGYALRKNKKLTPSMEDYLEMVYRLSQKKGYTRINELASALHVQPSSASKMVQKLTKANYLQAKKYGLIELTSLGHKQGHSLLQRHQIIEKLLALLGVSTNLLEQTEKIEHNITDETTKRITCLVQFLENNQAWFEFREKKLNNFTTTS